MAIKIPSKNIYTIENPKIRDNAIDNINIGYNKVASLTEFDKVVYVDTQEITPSGYAGEPNQENLVTAMITKGGYVYYYGFSYIRIERSYSKVTSRIPIIGNNYYVSSIVPHSQEDKTIGNFRVLGKTKTGLAVAVVSGKSTTVSEPEFSVGGFDYGDEPTEEQGVLAIPQNGTTFEDSITINYNDLEETRTNTLTFEDKVSDFSKISTQYITEDGIDYLETTLTYLTRLRVTKLKGINENLNIQTSSSTIINGDYVEYYPENIEITFYGNTVGISVEDNTIVLGNSSGSKPLKIDGNELMQNSSDISNKYKKTLSKYQNGKETAIIRCDIDDYYDDNSGNLIISSNSKNLFISPSPGEGNLLGVKIEYLEDGGVRISGTANGTTIYSIIGIELYNKGIKGNLSFSLTRTETQDTPIEYVLTKTENYGSPTYEDIEIVDDKAVFEIDENTLGVDLIIAITQGVTYNQTIYPMISYGIKNREFEKGCPMTFQLYDEVIPMKYKASGNDEPLSYNLNKEPKVFKVLGIKFSSSGKVFQELFLQEA